MIVLGIIDSKPSSAALLEDGRVLAATAEERLCRMKLASGFPSGAINQVLSDAGISNDEIDSVAVAQQASVFEPEAIPWSGWFDEEEPGKTYAFDQLSSTLAPMFGRVPLAWKAHHRLKKLVSQERVKAIPDILKYELGIAAPVKFYDHHLCHAATAYYTSQFDRALVITLDGGGDGRSGSVYLGIDGVLTELASVDSFNSLGNFYSYITELCGFRAEKHEGKITGLAALGEPEYVDILRQFIGYSDPGRIRYLIPMYHRSALKRIRQRLPRDFDIANLAASVQVVLEEVGIRFVRHWVERTGMSNVAVAGGVFANVKFNQRVHEIDGVQNLHVYPAMDDGGLAVGSALIDMSRRREGAGKSLRQPIENVYYGPQYAATYVESAQNGMDFPNEYVPDIHKRVAELLAQGHVVARYTGRMEFGPRALGHRSILYQTTDPSVNDWLNDHLKRTEFMPFAPATLVEYARDCYENMEGAEVPAQYMTITFNCTPKMRKESPGVVHVDGTARPQIIDPKSAPDFHKILTEYHRITGIPSLINTSFNMHGEPIVCSPDDAILSFEQGNLEYLAIDNWLVFNPEAIQRRAAERTAAQPAAVGGEE